MKYHELAARLKKIGCYELGKQTNGHPLWYSPLTGRAFKMSIMGQKKFQKGL